ncbi:phage tail protein [Emticicia sp. C21]|uniref:phage tail protein n=1 Tax=Emticicia sp. C21 TaxID=2302915 RepID=UPI000E353AF0|nr:tail fiber protein [Emticicia sp. C21]RFS16201.1 hypothetical protein D0T08_10945 [Emticicia sp. C21]
MKKFLSSISTGLILYFCSVNIVHAQSTLITPGNNQPNITATSTNNGILVPQITLTGNLTSADPVSNPGAGLLIYNIGDNQDKGFYYWTGSTWQLLGGAQLTATAPISITSNTIKLNSGTAAGQLLTWDGYNWVNTYPKPADNLDNRQPYLTLNFSIALQGIYPSQNGYEPFLGEISIYGFNFAPTGWALCNGQLLATAQNDALFTLLGTTYGGNGTSTFALPDLRGRVPVHKGQGSGLSNYTIGQSGGTETLTIDNKY